jgi:hypothetical protein
MQSRQLPAATLTGGTTAEPILGALKALLAMYTDQSSAGILYPSPALDPVICRPPPRPRNAIPVTQDSMHVLSHSQFAGYGAK